MKTTTFTDNETESSLINSLTDAQVEELMADDMLPEYDVDYSKVKPNRFAKREAALDVQIDQPNSAHL